MDSTAKYWSVREIAEKYGFTLKAVREECNARGARFAFKLKENGRYYIDPRKFKEHLERKRRER